MKALDDILIGFLIFFALERTIRLIGNTLVEPWALVKTGNKEKAENWKLFSEVMLLLVALALVIRYQKQLHKLNTA